MQVSSSNDVVDENSEIIVLDVRLAEMIHNRAFRAVLENGHTLVAYIPRMPEGAMALPLQSGDSARVRMSPYDMSRGELVTV